MKLKGDRRAMRSKWRRLSVIRTSPLPQAYIFFGPPPASDQSVAWTTLGAYAVFAAVVGRLERTPQEVG